MEEKERAREVFEEIFFKPMEKVLSPFLNEEALASIFLKQE